MSVSSLHHILVDFPQDLQLVIRPGAALALVAEAAAFALQGFFGALDVLVEFDGGDALGAFREDELLFGQVASGDVDFRQHIAQFFDDAFDVGVGGLTLVR